MIQLFFKELQEISHYFKRNYTEIVIIGASTLFMVFQMYFPIKPSLVVSYLFYFFLLPIITIIIFLRKNPLDYGLRTGNYKLGTFYVIISIIAGFPILFLGSFFSSVGNYYSMEFNFYDFFIKMVPMLFAWEFLLRGFLLFGLEKRFKEAAILIQTVPFVLLHLGKPEVEILICIPMGLWFGYIAYKSRSFWPAFATHAFINFTLKYFVNL